MAKMRPFFPLVIISAMIATVCSGFENASRFAFLTNPRRKYSNKRFSETNDRVEPSEKAKQFFRTYLFAKPPIKAVKAESDAAHYPLKDGEKMSTESPFEKKIKEEQLIQNADPWHKKMLRRSLALHDALEGDTDLGDLYVGPGLSTYKANGSALSTKQEINFRGSDN